MTLMDEVMVECHAGTQFDGLLKSISKAMNIVLDLTRGVVNSEDSDSLVTRPTQRKPIEVPTPSQQVARLPLQQPSPQYLEDGNVGFRQEIVGSVDRSIAGASPPDAALDYTYFRSAATAYRLPPPVFGNGWIHHEASMPQIPPPDQDTIGLIRPHCFLLTLVETNLANSYETLLKDPTSAASRSIFRWSLKFQTPEALLYCIRWILGPGRKCLYRSVDIPVNEYARWLSSGRQVKILEDDADILEFEKGFESPESHIPESPPPSFLNAAEVLQKLRDLNCRWVDDYIMEITVPRKYNPLSKPAASTSGIESVGIFS